MSIRRAVARLRHKARRAVVRTPYLWDAAMFLRRDKRSTLARRDTAIVIEGFQRSGNTFSVAAFIVANGTGPHVGRHLHGAPHLFRAIRYGVPGVLLIRRPLDAVSSYVVRWSDLSPHEALLEYLDFYRTAWRVRNRVVVAPFETVVSDFGAVIESVNQRFGTSFARYEPTPENEEAAFALVEEMNRQECGGEVVETHVGRPSARRRSGKALVQEALQAPRTRRLLVEAERLYEQIVRTADVHEAPPDRVPGETT
jgi:hypothetical protein